MLGHALGPSGFRRAFVIQGEEALEDFGIGESGRPAVGREDGLVELAMRIGQPGWALVVEVGEGAVLALQFGRAGRIQPGIALLEGIFRVPLTPQESPRQFLHLVALRYRSEFLQSFVGEP